MHDLNDFPAQALPDGLRHARHIEAALSGGLDSVVLLHLLSRLAGRLNIKLTAVHVHHGLQDEADDWLEFCRDYCDRLAVPLRWQKVDVVSDGFGIEAAARPAAGSWRILGWDAVGTVRAVGRDVSGFRVGDRVFHAGAINRPGCYAQLQAVATPRTMSAMRSGTTWPQAM